MDMMALDPFGMSQGDMAMVFVVNYLTSIIKDYLKDLVPEWVKRLHTLVPFIIAFAICYVIEPKDPLSCSIRIGMYATLTWNIWRKTVQGQ